MWFCCYDIVKYNIYRIKTLWFLFVDIELSGCDTMQCLSFRTHWRQLVDVFRLHGRNDRQEEAVALRTYEISCIQLKRQRIRWHLAGFIFTRRFRDKFDAEQHKSAPSSPFAGTDRRLFPVQQGIEQNSCELHQHTSLSLGSILSKVLHNSCAAYINNGRSTAQ